MSASPSLPKSGKPPGWWDRRLASVCARCPICRRARAHQAGPAFELVRRVEARLCPFCRAYARVHQRPAHAPNP
jgi:hypothetical protein